MSQPGKFVSGRLCFTREKRILAADKAGLTRDRPGCRPSGQPTTWRCDPSSFAAAALDAPRTDGRPNGHAPRAHCHRLDELVSTSRFPGTTSLENLMIMPHTRPAARHAARPSLWDQMNTIHNADNLPSQRLAIPASSPYFLPDRTIAPPPIGTITNFKRTLQTEHFTTTRRRQTGALAR